MKEIIKKYRKTYICVIAITAILIVYGILYIILLITGPKTTYPGIMKFYYNLVYNLTPCNGEVKKIDNEYLSFEYLHFKDSREIGFLSTKRDLTRDTFYSFFYFNNLENNMELNIWNEKYFKKRLLKNIKSGKYHYQNWTSGSRDIEIDKELIKRFENDQKITYDNILYSTINLPIDKYKRIEIDIRGYRFIMLDMPYPDSNDHAKAIYGILRNGDIFEMLLKYEGFYQGKLLTSLGNELYYNIILGGGMPESHFIPVPKEISHNKQMDCTFKRIIKTLKIKK